MVLCQEPWYNEPGHEEIAKLDDPKHVSAVTSRYNQEIRRVTLSTAIMGWVKQTPDLWKDVVDQHFKTHANDILRTAVEWSKFDDMAPAVPHKSEQAPSLDHSADKWTSWSMDVNRRQGKLDNVTSILTSLQTALDK